MSIRNLDAVFHPKSVAMVGAGERSGSVGAVLARNLFRSGFKGPILPVHPRHQAIQGVLAYPDVASLPLAPELAVLCTPPGTVSGLVGQLAERGCRGVVVITAGFGEGGDADGLALRQRVLDAARPHRMRIVGPNCLGVLVPGSGLNASFSHVAPEEGGIAFVAQSGAIVSSVLDWGRSRGVGFSHLVSLGDMADVDFGDMLDYLSLESSARAILLYIESIKDARKFLSAARAAARNKPVIAIKAGRHPEGARAAASHTGALAGADAVYDAAFRRAGVLRVEELDELFDAVETLALAPACTGGRLAVMTNGGGFGVLAADALVGRGGRLAELTEETVKRLDEVLPSTWSRANPVDIIGDAPGNRYADALKVLLDAPGADAVLVLHGPTAVASSTEAARAVIETAAGRRRTLLTSWVGGEAVAEARRLLAEHRIPTYETPDKAVRGFLHVVQYHRRQELLMETPPAVQREAPRDAGVARGAVERAAGEGREWLRPEEVRAVLGAYGVSAVESRAAATPAEVANHAEALGCPVAVKIRSPDLVHKSEFGGVRLDLISSGEARDAAEAMEKRLRAEHPEARLEGFAVEPMVRRPGAFELIVGMHVDQQFGPVLLFGHGGTEVEVVNDRALALPPLNLKLAREVMERTRIHRLLRGYRDRPPVDLDAVALTLLQVSQLITDVPEIQELDINPLWADAKGVLALDARIRVAPAGGSGIGADRLAIRPYPAQLEEWVELPDGRRLLLRPVRPEDEPALHAGFASLSEEEVRMRFFTWKKTLTHPMAARLTQIDYEREMALVLLDPQSSEPEILGVVRISADADNERGEFALLLQRRMTGMGLGLLLMRRVLDYARDRGIREVYGEVLRENRPMLKLCRYFGFEQRNDPEDTGVVAVSLRL